MPRPAAPDPTVLARFTRDDQELEQERYQQALARWRPDPGEINVPLKLARVILQDFTGVPAVVDLAAMRDAIKAKGGQAIAVAMDVADKASTIAAFEPKSATEAGVWVDHKTDSHGWCCGFSFKKACA